MPSRHTGTIAALLLTAALFLAMPGLMRREGDTNRMAESLRPPRMRTLTVWLLPDGPEDRKMIGEICAAFEKQQKGARIFLRRVTAEELYGENAVLPDVVLYATGEINRPEDALLPLAIEQPHASGQFAGKTYGIPLWYAPELLCYPEAWSEDPWPMLTKPDTLTKPTGVSLQRLMLSCPGALRASLTAAVMGRVQSTPEPQEKRDSVPPSRGRTPTPAPAVRQLARIASTLREGEKTLPLFPETSDRVRYASLCRDGEDARAFLALLEGWEPSSFSRVGAEITLPNAYAHTREEIEALCLDGFSRGDDPALTLIRLR